MTNRYIFDARIWERKMKDLLKMFCADVAGLSASKLAVVNRKTSQRIDELLRRRVVELAREEARPLTGEVEIDESYFGPRRVRVAAAAEPALRRPSSDCSNVGAKSALGW